MVMGNAFAVFPSPSTSLTERVQAVSKAMLPISSASRVIFLQFIMISLLISGDTAGDDC
jgi:hypothetical protein